MEVGRGGWRGVGTVGCSLAAVILMWRGIGALISPTSWPNDRVAGGLIFLAAFCLVPPLLTGLRTRAIWARPPWVPLLFAVLAQPVAVTVSRPFTPTGKARAELRVLAITDSRREITAGKLRAAQDRLERFSNDHDVVVDRLLAEIHEAQAKRRQPASTPVAPTSQLSETPQDPASTYAERVETYWLPAARALPDAPPKDHPAFDKLLTQIDELAIDAADGSGLPLSPPQRALRSKFMTALSDKQAKLLPAMRRGYAKELDAKLFRHDVRVSARGTTLTLVGAVFARNANVEDMQTELGPVVNRLRFRRIEYRWSPYLNSSLHYDLDPPGDRKVARWDGAAFSKVRK